MTNIYGGRCRRGGSRDLVRYLAARYRLTLTILDIHRLNMDKIAFRKLSNSGHQPKVQPVGLAWFATSARRHQSATNQSLPAAFERRHGCLALI